MCIKGMADEAGIHYELNRNAASSHLSRSSISFFSFTVVLQMIEWEKLYDGEQPETQTQMAREPKPPKRPKSHEDGSSKLRRIESKQPQPRSS